MKSLISTLILISLSVAIPIEEPITLPKTEGSKSFDFEIDNFNNNGVSFYKAKKYQSALENFQKGLNLAKKFRDPSLGVLYFNVGLSLHMLKKHGEATEHFYSARRFARGYEKIINSPILQLHECGLNPSIPCDAILPDDMNIEGSH